MAMEIKPGHLFMADLTGFTAYLTAPELDHTGPTLSALSTTIIDASKRRWRS